MALKDDSPVVRSLAAASLGEVGDERAVQPLIAAVIEGCQDIDLRLAVARSLKQIGTPAIKPLVSMLGHENWNLRQLAREVIDSLDWHPSEDQYGAWYWIYLGQWEKCAEIGEPAIDPLITVLKDRKGYVRKAAVESLGVIGGARAIDALVATLQDRSQDVRKSASVTLDSLGWQPEDDENGAFYWMAKEKWARCVKIGSPAVEPLLNALEDADWNAISLGDALEIAEALEKIGLSAVDPLIAALEDGTSRWREIYAEVLGRIGNTRAIRPLVAALRDAECAVRAAAAEGLGRIGSPIAIGPLSVALHDEDERVRQAAGAALKRLGAPAQRDES